nr:ecdysis triggering hormone [Mythimna separata]
MNSKLATLLMAYCLIHFFSGADGSFIKPNNVPRVGRSNEESPFDQGSFGYVIKTNKNIPRMGRRNYDSENRYDIPKFYQLPSDNFDVYEGEPQEYNMPIEAYYPKQLQNMKR